MFKHTQTILLVLFSILTITLLVICSQSDASPREPTLKELEQRLYYLQTMMESIVKTQRDFSADRAQTIKASQCYEACQKIEINWRCDEKPGGDSPVCTSEEVQKRKDQGACEKKCRLDTPFPASYGGC